MCFVRDRCQGRRLNFALDVFSFVKTTNLQMERKLEVMPVNMHIPGLFTGSNGLVFLWRPLYRIGKRVDQGVPSFFAGGTCKN
jgi:hypothetical protein